MAQAYLGRAASASMRRSFSPAGDASGPAEPMQCESRDPAAASVSTRRGAWRNGDLGRVRRDALLRTPGRGRSARPRSGL